MGVLRKYVGVIARPYMKKLEMQKVAQVASHVASDPEKIPTNKKR